MTPQQENPFARLETAAKRKRFEADGAKAFSTARSRLILSSDKRTVFFAMLSMRLRSQQCWDLDTAATDGRSLEYNPEWFCGLTDSQQIAIVGHEVMHCVADHMGRRQHRCHDRWNIACDLAINSVLDEAGFDLPKTRLMPGEHQFADMPRGLCAEEYYSRLPLDKSQGQPQGRVGGGSGSDPGGCGGVKDSGRGGDGGVDGGVDPSQQQQISSEWQIAAAQAAQVAKQRGSLPAGLERLVDEIVNPSVDWQTLLRRFLSAAAANDYSWFPPNRRWLHPSPQNKMGMYLPSLRSESLGRVVLAIDTSGSIGQDELRQFAGEAQGVLEAFDCELDIVYHDSRVQHVEHWTRTDGTLQLEPKGGGGTDHRPVFDWVENGGEDGLGAVPTCLICLTDGYTCYPKPDQWPEYPVLWAMTNDTSKAPFGENVRVSFE